MCGPVVAATRGLEDVALLETVVFLVVHTKEGLRNIQGRLSPGKTYIRHYSGKDPRYRVEIPLWTLISITPVPGGYTRTCPTRLTGWVRALEAGYPDPRGFSGIRR